VITKSDVGQSGIDGIRGRLSKFENNLEKLGSKVDRNKMEYVLMLARICDKLIYKFTIHSYR
jgi:hypothetical protein